MRHQTAPAAGIALGLGALAETLLRTDGSGVLLSVGMLAGVCATAPLVLLRDHALAVAATVTAATAATGVLYRAPFATGAAAVAAAWGLLAWRRLRRARADADERDASRRAMESTLLELTARGERARIARELHDVVAHHISMISVQAETARLATPGMPELGAERLRGIGDTARTALTEMRRLLGVLREDAGTERSRRPQPGLQQLLDLLDETRDAAGTSARLIVRGRVAALDPGVELTAYRIVQEALTNARRHAPGAAVDVEIDYGADALRLRVRDNGPGPPPEPSARPGTTAARPDGGHGLLGMRERAAAVGGELRAGPAPVNGFVVEAVLPTAEEVR
ncbi:sensor histidine kinase [Actinomadura yumaensis]|uniref:sensor histidine kinase n=1 Tax=Actinomadura TaxID=1988 RepID=UPI0019D6A9C2|nr:sensor histidine kinase [Actinomadura sp. J1-007]